MEQPQSYLCFLQRGTQLNGVLTCPKCGHKQEEDIPEAGCAPFYRCRGCGQLVEARTCCVFCDYGDRPCPVGHKAKPE